MKKIAHVIVHLDDDIPEYMHGLYRCDSVTSEDEDGNELRDYEELIDNSEFHSKEKLIAYVAEKIGVSTDAVAIEDEEDEEE